MGGRFRNVARWAGRLEPLIVALAAPFLIFPTFSRVGTATALAVLLVAWLARWIGTGRPGSRTPLDLSLLLLVLMIPVAVWASAVPELTLPTLTGLILGLAVFRATVNAVRTPRQLFFGAACFLALGVGLSVVGLLGTNWIQKWPALTPLLARIPRLPPGLPGVQEGIHPNVLAGALLLFLPVSLAALEVRGFIGRRRWIVRLAAVLLALCFGALLVLTQSRSAWMGAAAGLGAMAWIRSRRARWLLAGAALVLALGLVVIGPLAVARAVFPPAGSGETGTLASTVTLEGRVEIWSRALYAIQDFPFTGTGLGTFRRELPQLYPLFLAGPDVDIGHAHNIFLQVALDLGLPGLIAYLALVGTALWIAWRVARAPDTFTPKPDALTPNPSPSGERGGRRLGLGIAGALVAFHVYGLTDAGALVAKPGVALWMLLGLAAAAWSAVGEDGGPAVTPAPATPVIPGPQPVLPGEPGQAPGK